MKTFLSIWVVIFSVAIGTCMLWIPFLVHKYLIYSFKKKHPQQYRVGEIVLFKNRFFSEIPEGQIIKGKIESIGFNDYHIFWTYMVYFVDLKIKIPVYGEGEEKEDEVIGIEVQEKDIVGGIEDASSL